jgi:ribonucleoside-diphosphate reductase alpha chain
MQAPTGSTSLVAGTTSGIEPVYEFEFIRRDRLGEHIIRHSLYDQWLKEQGVTNGEAKNVTRPDYFVGANDLSPEDHVRVQAVIQKYVDASISKTVNAPETHTVEDVKKVYNLAYELGLKGVAYMRDGSRPGVLSRKEEKKEEKKEKPVFDIMPRPMVINGSTYQIDTPVGRAYVTINSDEQGYPFEVFVNIGKPGSDVYAMTEGLGRLVSLILRMHSKLNGKEKMQHIIEELTGIGGATSLGFGDSKIRSLPDAVAKVLIKHFAFTITNGNAPVKKIADSHQEGLLPVQALAKESNYDLCPKCGVASFAYEEGCKKCYSCGYSECG